MSRKIIIIFFLIIVSYSFVLRVWDLGHSSLWIDESFTINSSFAILERGVPILDSGELYKTGILYNYLGAGLIKTFGLDPFSPWQARLPSVIFGVLSVLLTYILSARIFSKNTGIIASFIIAFSYWEIAWSRQARGYVALQFFLILSFYFLWQWLVKKEKKFLFLLLFSLLFSFLSHQIGVVFIPAFFLIAILFPKKRISLKDFLTITFVFGVFSLVYFFLFGFPEINFYRHIPHYNRFIRSEYLIFIKGALLAVFLGIFNKDRKAVFSLFFIIISSYLIIGHFVFLIHYRYLFPIFPFLIILSSYAPVRFFEIIQKILKIKNPLFTLIPSLALVLFFSFSHLTFIPKNNYILEYGSPQPNFKEAYGIIKENWKEGDIIISPYTPLNKIYLNEKGFWLPICLIGRKEEMWQRTIERKDYYLDSPVISSEKEFLKIINSNSGYIVIDQMARGRARSAVDLIEIHKKVELIYNSPAPKVGGIWLYKF